MARGHDRLMAVPAKKTNVMEKKNNDEFRDFKSPWHPFYYNPKDKRVFVPKLIGIGYTFNFGHWATWVIIVALFVVPLLITYWVK